MNLTITPTRLQGSVTPPPSKSQAHRLLICAALAEGESRLANLTPSQDVDATRRCLAALREDRRGLPQLDCGESGSTLRFLLPLALVLRGGGVFTGRGRLMDRPQRPYFDLFDEKGVRYDQKNGILTVEGRLTPGTYRLPGNVSSQFVTGLLYALPLLEGNSEILLTSPLESRSYVDMTLEALALFGIRGVEREDRFLIPGGQRYRPCEAAVEADWSQAAFWLAAVSLGSPVRVEGLDQNSAQGDRVIADLFSRLSWPGDVEIDVSDCPDLAPPLAVMAAVRAGVTRLTGAARLRLKESDRLEAIGSALRQLGGDAEEGPDFLTIRGRSNLTGGCAVDCRNDHRIAMMAAVAATACREPVTLLGAECVAKSYPHFWDDYRMLGGELCEYTGQ